MRQNKDASHETNVNHFEDLILICEGMGARYNPPADTLKTTALRAQLTTGKGIFTTLETANDTLAQAIGVRKAKIELLKPLATRVTNNFAACDVTPEAIEHIRSINKKIQQGIKISQPEEATPPPANDEQSESKRKSTQQSIDYLVSFWDNFVTALSNEPNYLPTETELTVTNLQSMMETIHTLNTTIKTKDVSCINKRLDRDKYLYTDHTGMVDTAYRVKNYLKSILGPNSSEYIAVDKLRFIRYKYEESPAPLPSGPAS